MNLDGTGHLPKGWEWAALGEVIREAQAGFASGQRDPKGVIQLRMNNVTRTGRLDWSSYIRVPADSDTIDTYRLEAGDVLFNNTNSTELVGKSALFQPHEEPVVFSNHFTRLRTMPTALSSEYLAFWLLSQWQQGVFAGICNRWIGQSAVKSETLLALKIPRPPLAVQERITAVLTGQLAALERARVAAAAQLRAAETLPMACRWQVFNGPEAQKWPRVKIGEICEINPSRRGLLRPDDAPTTFIPMSAVEENAGGILRSEIKPFREVKKGYTYVGEGDVLFAKITPCMQNGKHAIARGLIDGVAFASTEFHVLRPKGGIFPEWIHHYLTQPDVLRNAAEHFTGAVGQQRVPESYLAGLDLPLPPSTEQQRIVERIGGQVAFMELARAAAEAQAETINHLPAVLLRQAFNGEL